MKRMSFLVFTLLILLESIHAQERDHFLLFTDSVVTSDGLKLATDIYISNESEIFPSLLILSLYDPLDPYPSLGGTFLGNKIGPAVQNQNIARNDQWVFESEVLSSPLTLLGSISAKLYVSSSVKSTDFIMMVQDVFPNDTIINIQEGGKRVDLKPNKVTEVNIDSWPTGYQLNPGHKLRVVITSSCFPRFNRKLNCDEPIYMARKIKKAVQTIYTGPKKPSSITLPVLNIVHD
ncbi:CocE/NonD family hydrolase [Petrimonas mucosa]|uniref:Cocaine esterase n=1 Tax=Petrimonas mucosa TaxID=1642646 RepID=A0A1G4G8F7_9BACT|nr:CocE/NonD family hydrolase [Petrimonas mucosa]SCM58773.1 Cocaine esterase [Petrimonas mucosa]